MSGSRDVRVHGSLVVVDSSDGIFLDGVKYNIGNLLTTSNGYTKTEVTSLVSAAAETANSIKGKLGITTLSGVNTGDETLASIKAKLGISTLTGVNTGDQLITLAGDVNGSGTSTFNVTIANGAVTLGKMANMATASLLGRITAGTGAPEVLSASTVKVLLALNNVDNTSDANKPVSTAVSTALADAFTNSVISGLEAMTVPIGATADRPAPGQGKIRYNSTIGHYEGWTPAGWVPLDNNILQRFDGSLMPASGTTSYSITAAPTASGGSQLWSQSVTPTVIGSTIRIRFSGMVDASNSARQVTIALFKGTTLLAFRVVGCGNNTPGDFILEFNDVTTSTAAVTYSARIGISSNTWYLGRPSGNGMGSTNRSIWSIEEDVL